MNDCEDAFKNACKKDDMNAFMNANLSACLNNLNELTDDRR